LARKTVGGAGAKKPRKPGSGGQNRHVRDERIAGQVKTLASIGTPQEDISRVVGLAVDTLNKHYREDWLDGYAIGNIKLRQSGMDQACGRDAIYDVNGRLIREELKPDKTAMIFHSKNRLQMRDVREISGPGGAPIAVSSVLDLGSLSDEELDVLAKARAKVKTEPSGS
jgi:hypothetical protein